MSTRKSSQAGTVLLPASLLLVVSLCTPFIAVAAADDSEHVIALEQKLDQSLQMIRELSARVHDLEAKLPKAPAAVAAPVLPPSPAQADTEQRLQAFEHTLSQMAASAASRSDDVGLPLHGFADVGIGSRNPVNAAVKGVNVGSLDFFLTPQLGAHTRSLFELNFEVGEDGNVGVDLERAQIGYQFGDAATVWLGRFHTPYGYYNTAYHHGQQIAVAVRRPRFIEFEDHGGVLPAHTVGAWLTGAERVGDQKITYDFYVGNSQRILDGTVDMNNPGNDHGSAIVGANVGLLFGGALDGLKLGLHAFTTRIEDQDLIPQRITRVNNFGAYAAYDTDRWEDIAELYIFDDQDLSGGTGKHRSEAGFVQLGYRAGRYTPYARYERAALQQSDNFFAAQRNGSSYYREALGVRFDVDLKSALKMELALTHLTDRDPQSYDEALIQYSIRF